MNTEKVTLDMILDMQKILYKNCEVIEAIYATICALADSIQLLKEKK